MNAEMEKSNSFRFRSTKAKIANTTSADHSRIASHLREHECGPVNRLNGLWCKRKNVPLKSESENEGTETLIEAEQGALPFPNRISWLGQKACKTKREGAPLAQIWLAP